MTLQRQAKRAKLNGAPLRSAEQLRGEVATLVFTPDRLAVVKGGPAARRAYFDRTLGAAAARPAPCRSSTRPPSASGTRRCGGSRSASRRATRSRRGRSRWRRSARSSSRRARGDRAARAGASPSGRRARPRRRRRSTTPASRPPRRRSRRGSSATSSAASPGSARTSTTSRSAPATATCGPSARRASSASRCSRCCSPRPRCSPSTRGAAAPAARRRPLGARRGRRRTLAERIGRVGQTIVTATGAEALPLEPAQLLEVTPGSVSVALMERLDGRSAASSRRFGPAADAGDMVGTSGPGRRPSASDRAERVAGADRPRRHAARERGLRDVGVRARPARREILEQLRPELGGPLRRRCASRPGPVPEPAAAAADSACRPAPRSAPSTVLEAAEIAAAIEDEELRETSRGRPPRASPRPASPLRPPFLIHCSLPAKGPFAGLF